MCELKKFTGQVDHRIDRTRKLTRTRRAIVEQSRSSVIQGEGGLFSEGAVFCPECQGTGLNLRGSQLERPRYRLAQVHHCSPPAAPNYLYHLLSIFAVE
jgi:hypothetical protein